MAVPTAWNSDVPGAGELMPDAGRVGDTGRTMPPRMGVNIGVAEEGMPRLTGDWAWWLKGDTGATGWTPPTDTTSKLPSVWKWRWASSVIGGGGGTPGVDDSSTVRSCIGSGGGGRLRFFFFFFFGDDSSVSAATELRRGDVRLPSASWEVSLRRRNHAHSVSNWRAQAGQHSSACKRMQQTYLSPRFCCGVIRRPRRVRPRCHSACSMRRRLPEDRIQWNNAVIFCGASG